MEDLQEVFNKINELKDEQKKIQMEYKNNLAAEPQYEEVLDEIKGLKIKKEQLENESKSMMGSSWDKFEENKEELKSLQEMISDMAIKNITEGKDVNVTDKYNNAYEPAYKVSFKKVQ